MSPMQPSDVPPSAPEGPVAAITGERDYKAAVYGSLLVTTLLAVELRTIGDAAMVA